MFCIVMC